MGMYAGYYQISGKRGAGDDQLMDAVISQKENERFFQWKRKFFCRKSCKDSDYVV